MAQPILSNPDDLAAIIKRFRELRVDSQRKWGRMSPHQAVCHLADALRMALGDTPQPSRGDTWATRNIVRRIALHSPLRWPHGVRTIPGFDQAAGEGTPPAEFDADREELVRLHERLAGRANTPPVRIHPIFGPLTSAEWMAWGYRHADHHLRQFGH